MNSRINKTFYTCSTELWFLRYRKISKKAVKIGGFIYAQYIYFYDKMAASEKLIQEICETISWRTLK